MKKTFVMNGKEYDSMMDIARDLGVKRIYPKNFEKYGIVEKVEGNVEDVVPDVVPDEEKVEKETKVQKKQKKVEVDFDDLVEEVKENYSDLGIVDTCKKLGSLNVEKLLEICEALNIEKLWENIANENIRKMRLIMELKQVMFPGEKLPVVPASPWRGFTLDELLKLATENGIVDYRKTNEEKTQRMWLVKALKDAGVKPEKPEKDRLVEVSDNE